MQIFPNQFKKALLLASLMLFTNAFLQAQVALEYNFIPSTSAYLPITGTQLSANLQNLDDQTYSSLSIGFPFIYNGSTYNEFGLNTNGFIQMGTASLVGINYTPLSHTQTNNAIVDFGGDLQCNATGRLEYQTIGIAPNRICVVQWTNFHRFGQPLHNLNFQIRLHETTNDVEVVYGTMSSSTTTNFTVQVGLSGNNNTDFNCRTTTSNWSATTVGLSSLANCAFRNTITPTFGLTFRWSPCIGTNCFAFPRISGKMYIDYNNNSVQDAGDIAVSNHIISTSSGYATATNATGNYHILADTSNVLMLNTQVGSPHFTLQPATINITTVNTNAQTFGNNDFRLVPTDEINDLAVNVNTGRSRPGFATTVTLTYTNIGTTVLAGTLQFNMNSGANQILQYVSASVPFATQNGSVTTWNFAGLQPFETRTITVKATVPIPTPVNSWIANTLSGTVIGNETALANNTSTDSVQVRASFDPNDKTPNVSEITPAEVASSKEIIYTINFQNTGNDFATFVHIRDTLSNNIDFTKLRTIAASHNYRITVETDDSQTPKRQIVTWIFDNINLNYTSNNEPASHGFVKFAIPVQTNLMLGEQIENTAHIVFDYNRPIITNMATVLVNEITGTNDINNKLINCTITPNPATDLVNISFDTNQKAMITLIDIQGKIINTWKTNGTSTVLDLSNTPKGLYFLQIVTDNGVMVKKLIKQ